MHLMPQSAGICQSLEAQRGGVRHHYLHVSKLVTLKQCKTNRACFQGNLFFKEKRKSLISGELFANNERFAPERVLQKLIHNPKK